MRKIIAAAFAGIAMLAAAPASAATLLLNTTSTSQNGGKVFTDGTVTARVTGWSINSSGTIRKGSVGTWSHGTGVTNAGGDNSHTVDNSGWTDFLILQFDQSVSLTDGYFTTGWHYMHDTDATIGYSDLAGPIGTDVPLAGLSASVLSAANLYASGSVGLSGNSIRNINPEGFFANTWLIGASFANPDGYADGFKLKAVGYELEAAVPEPATWAMMLLGFFAVGGAMRSRSKRGVLAAA